MINKDEEIVGLGISTNALDTCTEIPGCMTEEEKWLTTIYDGNIGVLSIYVLHSWSLPIIEVQKEVQPYWSFTDEVVVIGRKTMKGIIIPSSLQTKALDKLHVNRVGTEKTGMLECQSFYWININTDIKYH